MKNKYCKVCKIILNNKNSYKNVTNLLCKKHIIEYQKESRKEYYQKNKEKLNKYRENKDSGLYNTFCNIKTRCNNPNRICYKNYGGRGIICEWKSYKDFKKDMYVSYLIHLKKYSRKNTTIDRINNDGNYCKKNCRWATWKEQNNNKRTINK